MAPTNKRHYRAALREQTLDDTTTCLSESQFQKCMLLSLLMYSCTMVLSFILGYCIGKHE